MHEYALGFLVLVLVSEPIELPKDVVPVSKRSFVLPLRIDPEDQKTIENVRIYFSADKGKTWKHHTDCKPTENRVAFTAPRDGLYYFSLQIETTDGKREPPDVADLTAAQKVFVNAARRSLRVGKSNVEFLREELEDLRAEVNHLRRRIKELEAELKSK